MNLLLEEVKHRERSIEKRVEDVEERYIDFSVCIWWSVILRDISITTHVIEIELIEREKWR